MLKTDRLENNFTVNEPIFTSEIQSLYPEISHSSLFRNIRDTVDYGLLMQFVRGVYCLPTGSGKYGIDSDDVIRKKYLGWGDETYGILAGPAVENRICGKRAVGLPVEIISNNETSRGRRIVLHGKEYTVKKSRCQITSANAYAYMLVQVFDELIDPDLTKTAKGSIMRFIRRHGISLDQLADISGHFTARPMRNMEYAGILQQIA